jgi:hypothetical protein
MAELINLEAYRFFKAVKDSLKRDSIKCKFKYDDSVFVALVAQLNSNSIGFSEFYIKVAAYAMSLDSVTVKS